MLKLLSATPSPFARKVRVALLEKTIPFELLTINPWDVSTDIEAYNPLGKIPVLILENNDALYESSFILEWLELEHPSPPLISSKPAEYKKMKQIQVLTDGICDAFILLFFEQLRDKDRQSRPWIERQLKKIYNAMSLLNSMLPAVGFCVGDRFSIADISVVSAVDYLSLRFEAYKWQDQFKNLEQLANRLSRRQSFLDTVPTAQEIDKSII
jgi:glutathione S-transferase